MSEQMYLRDIGTEVYQLIVNDEQLKELLPADHVFQYHIPEEFQEKSPIVRITMINMLPNNYADNEQLAWDYTIQIDVWNEGSPFIIAQHINRIMKGLNFRQSTPIFEFDIDTAMLRDGRRYEGKIMINEDM